MDDLFHSVGISLDLKEELNRCFRTGAIDSAVPLSILPEPSGPDALPVFIPFRYLINSSAVHRMSVCGRSEASGANSKMLQIVRAPLLVVFWKEGSILKARRIPSWS